MFQPLFSLLIFDAFEETSIRASKFVPILWRITFANRVSIYLGLEVVCGSYWRCIPGTVEAARRGRKDSWRLELMADKRSLPPLGHFSGR